MTEQFPCYDAALATTVDALAGGERDLSDLIETTCDRIDAVDDRLQAFRDEPRRQRRLRQAIKTVDGGQLAGVPVGIKDIIHVDGFETRAGSALPPELFDGPEATLVTRLRTADGVIAGKTRTTEFAGFAPARTHNPRAPGYTPGGSSSGSAAAVAAGLVPLAIGTQTGGSVIRPAAFCGVVGYKPSFGRIPTDGVLTRAWSLDTVGTFTQELAGARLAAGVLCDTWTPDTPTEPVIGVPTGTYREQATTAGEQAFQTQVATLDAAGLDLRREPAFEAYRPLDAAHRRVSTGEFARVHAEWFPEYESFYRTRTAQTLRAGQAVTDDALREARATIEAQTNRMHERMDELGIDLWVTPAAPGPPPATRTSTGDSVMNRPWTALGMPAVTIPAGHADGRPVGLQCVARRGADEALLQWAESIVTALA